jgi:uncharacterized membrane-anchored protein
MTELRHTLNQELHARPEMRFNLPTRCVHVLLHRNKKNEEGTSSAFTKWQETFGFGQPVPGSRFYRAGKGNLQLGWEEHSESHAWTLVEEDPPGAPFSAPLSELLPGVSQEQISDDLITGMRLEAIDDSQLNGRNGFEVAQEMLACEHLVGGWMSDQHASVWTTYKPDADGLICFLIIGHGLSSGRLGRLVHRLTDIDDYRMMALLGLPRAQKSMVELNEIEPSLDAIMERLARSSGGAEQETLLVEITRVSARVEHLITLSAYRFSASKAYAAIVDQRFDDIREEIQDGHERITVFLNKTLSPAMRTCAAAERRALSIAERIARAAHVLNTQVDLLNKKQNQAILRSLERQARLQVSLQMAVEGLSIVAISYYGTGLVHYLLKSAQSLGMRVDPELATGVAIPLIVLLTWGGVRLAKRKVRGQSEVPESK